MSTNESSRRYEGRNRRRRKWVRADLQLKMSLTTFCVVCVVLLINLQFTLIGLWLIHRSPSATVEETLQRIQSMLFTEFFFAAAATIPLALWVGVIYTFNVAGPLFRFKKYFANVRDGQWGRPLTLRDGDRLQDIKDTMNEALDAMRERIRFQRDLLSDAREVLAQAPDDHRNPTRVKQLLEEISANEHEIAKRFGEEAEPDDEARGPARDQKEPVAVGTGVDSGA